MAMRGLNITEMARRASIDTAHISRILAGTRQPGPDALNAIAKALGLAAEVVFQRAGLLPTSTEYQHDPLKQDWDEIYASAQTEEEREELIEFTRIALQRILNRRRKE